MSAALACSIRVLGPIRASVGGEPVELGGAKPTALLAALVLEAPRAVSADRLIDLLWEEEPPRTARKSLHVHVSRLRRVLPPGLVTSEPHGYALRLEGVQVDLHDFKRLHARGRDELHGGEMRAAAATLRDALALWRGPALAGLEAEPFAAAAAAPLEDERLAALESRVEADLALGHHAVLVPELESLVVAHPYREGFRRQLMLALYRAGRQTDSLAAYRDARRFLSTEVGLEPGRALRELESAILQHDPTLDAPVASSVGLPRRRRRALAAAIATGAALVVGLFALGPMLGRDDAAAPARPVVVPNAVAEIDARTGAIRRVTRVGRAPDQLAVGSGGIWVVNKRDRTVSRIRRGGLVETIGGVTNADHIEIEGDDVWISSFDQSTVARVDADTLEVVEQVGLPLRHAEGMTVGGGYLWVTNPAPVRAQGKETVSRIDLRSGEVVSTVAVGKTPIFATFGYGSVWVANFDSDTVSVISPGSDRAETIDVGDGPLGIASGYGGVWVVLYWDRELVRLDPAARTVVARTALDEGPLDVAVGAGGVWVTNRDSSTVVKVDPDSNDVALRVRLPRGVAPYGVVANDDAVWVSLQRCEHPPCF